jgi:hypothetical protein
VSQKLAWIGLARQSGSFDTISDNLGDAVGRKARTVRLGEAQKTKNLRANSSTSIFRTLFWMLAMVPWCRLSPSFFGKLTSKPRRSSPLNAEKFAACHAP